MEFQSDRFEAFMKEMALDFFQNEYLEQKYAGYPNIIRSIVEDGKTFFGEQPETDIEDFLRTIPYITVQPATEGYKLIDVTLDKIAFFTSQHMQVAIHNRIDEAEEKMKLLKQEANRLKSFSDNGLGYLLMQELEKSN